MITLLISEENFRKLELNFGKRNEVLCHEPYQPGDWNRFNDANAGIAEALQWPGCCDRIDVDRQAEVAAFDDAWAGDALGAALCDLAKQPAPPEDHKAQGFYQSQIDLSDAESRN